MELVPMLHLLMKKFDLSLNQLGIAAEIDVSALSKILRGEHREFKSGYVESLLDELERMGKLTDPLEKEIWRRALRIAAFSHYDVYKAVEPRLKGITKEEERRKIISEYLRKQYPTLVAMYERTRGQFPTLIPIEVVIVDRLLRERSTSNADRQLFSQQLEVIININRLKDANSFVRLRALQSLHRIGRNAKAAVPDLAAAVPDLINALKVEEEARRRYAAATLGEIGQDAKAAVPDLINALMDEHPTVRASVASALGGIGPEAKVSIPAHIASLKDQYTLARAAAANALGSIGEADTVVPTLINSLKDQDPLVRFAAASALRRIGSEARAAVPDLITALEDEDGGVRAAVASALGEIGSEAKGAIPALIASLKDEALDLNSSAVYREIRSMGPEGGSVLPKLFFSSAFWDKNTHFIINEALSKIQLSVLKILG